MKNSVLVNIKRNLVTPSNYSELLGTKLLLDSAIKEATAYVIEAAAKGYIVKYLTMQGALERVRINLSPSQFHKYSSEEGIRIKSRCVSIVFTMTDYFYKELTKYCEDNNLSVTKFSSASLHIKQLEYLSSYLTYNMEGKPRPAAPLTRIKLKQAYKASPISQRIKLSQKELF